MIKQLTRVSFGALGGAFAYYCYENNRTGTVRASWTTGYTPDALIPNYHKEKWDSNWDQRSSEETSKPPKKSIDVNNNIVEVAKPSVTRNIILIRHGQYRTEGKTDKERILTELGREQARLTGRRLKELCLPYDDTRIVKSTMTRAQETGEIIQQSLTEIPELQVKSCPFLEEGAPILPDPPVGHWKPPKCQFFQDGARIETAFRKYFYRADVDQKKDSYDVLVCHGNVIRYFVLRALQFPVDGWLRLSLNHASITWIVIRPNGRVGLKFYGDTGFMPPNCITSC